MRWKSIKLNVFDVKHLQLNDLFEIEFILSNEEKFAKTRWVKTVLRIKPKPDILASTKKPSSSSYEGFPFLWWVKFTIGSSQPHKHSFKLIFLGTNNKNTSGECRNKYGNFNWWWNLYLSLSLQNQSCDYESPLKIRHWTLQYSITSQLHVLGRKLA